MMLGDEISIEGMRRVWIMAAMEPNAFQLWRIERRPGEVR